MKALKIARQRHQLSQRQLAALARVSYKTIQLIESNDHDVKLSTLNRLVHSLGFPRHAITRQIRRLLESPVDSIHIVSGQIVENGEGSWKTWLFNFVDAFRRQRDDAYIHSPPIDECSERIRALCAATVETLCDEVGRPIPMWCTAMPVLKTPWFVSQMNALKSFALVESPVHFRKRNIFVLDNFLNRA